jgi:hypothetical protein
VSKRKNLCEVTPCNLIDVYRHNFYCSTLMTEATRDYETSVNISEATRFHIPGHIHFHSHDRTTSNTRYICLNFLIKRNLVIMNFYVLIKYLDYTFMMRRFLLSSFLHLIQNRPSLPRPLSDVKFYTTKYLN